MKVRSREGVARQRPPNKALVLFTCICILSSMQLAKGNPCGYNEMRKCSNGDCRCLKCLICPPGQGLYPQCSSTTLDGNMTMKCLPCQDGTYSNQNDFGSCHACHICDGQETLKECNATHNAKCKEGCMDGYKLNEFSHMCEKIPTIPRKKNITNNPPTSTRPYTFEASSLTLTTVSSNKDSGPDKIPITSTGPQKTVTARPTAAELPTSIILTGKNGSDSNMTIIKTTERIVKTSDLVYVFFSVFLFFAIMGFKYRQTIKSSIIRCKKHLLNEGQDKSNLEAIPMHPDPQEQEREETIVDLTNQSPPGHQEECFAQDIPRPNQLDPQSLDKAISCPTIIQSGDQNHATSRPPVQQQACSDHGTPGFHQVDLGGEGLDEVVISSPPGQQGRCLDHGSSMSQDPHAPGLDREPISITSALQPLDNAISISLDLEQHGEGLQEEIAMPDVPDVHGVLLKDLPSDLKLKVAVKISKKGLKGWIEIAKFLKVANDDELEYIETKSSYGESTLPGIQLFEIIEAILPQLTVKKFMEALKYVERKDVIDCIDCGLRGMYGAKST